MNTAKKVLNAFSAAELAAITGLTLHTINYLAREGYLRPTYRRGKVRGKVRYYSYRDLLVARIIQKLTATGLELKRLRQAIKLLNEDKTWMGQEEGRFDLLTTDGHRIYHHLKNGSLLELTPRLQQSFAFVLDVTKTQRELKSLIGGNKRRRFDLANHPLLFAEAKWKSA